MPLSDDFEKMQQNHAKWFKRGLTFFVCWFVFCLTLGLAGLSAVVWVAYKLLTHFQII